MGGGGVETRPFFVILGVSLALKVVGFSTKLAPANLHLYLSQRCTFWKSGTLDPARYVAAKSAEFICLHSGR